MSRRRKLERAVRAHRAWARATGRCAFCARRRLRMLAYLPADGDAATPACKACLDDLAVRFPGLVDMSEVQGR